MSTIDKLDLIANEHFSKDYERLNMAQRDFIFKIYLDKYATNIIPRNHG